MFNPAFDLQRSKIKKMLLGVLMFAVCIGLGISISSLAGAKPSSGIIPLQSGLFLFADLFFILFVVSFFAWWHKKKKERTAIRKSF